MAVAVMAVPFLLILRGGCDAGGHHRECHFPRLGFHLWYLLNLFVHRVLLEVFVEFSMAFVVLLATTVLRRLRQRGISACGMVLLGGFVASAWQSSSSRLCDVLLRCGGIFCRWAAVGPVLCVGVVYVLYRAGCR